MSYKPPEKPENKALKFFKWLNKWKFIFSLAFNIIMILTFIIGALGMIQFILEECLQAQGFGYAIIGMNKEWELALAALKDEEPFIRANIRMLRDTPNPITGKAFRAYADATQRKVQRDKAFYQYMIQKEKNAQYAKRVRR